MTILEYVDIYGNKTFSEEKFNEVDNIIFSSISYVNFTNIVKKRKEKITLRKAANLFFLSNYMDKNNMTSYKSAVTILRKIKDTRRYRGLLLYNYYYLGDESQQFSAITIEINKKLVYISYEGTDSLVSGWEEDFKMSYMFPVKAQRNAINYINKYIFTNKNIIIGGHSKGGNLALVAGMYANRFTKKRIIAIYSNDGPGLRNDEFLSDEYKIASLKLISIIPNYSLVSFILRHSNKYKVVESSKKGLFAHDLLTWQVDGTKFREAELSQFSKILNKTMDDWLRKYDYEERKKFTDSLFDVFRRANVNNLNGLMENKKLILKLIFETRGISKTTRVMMREFLSVLYEYVKLSRKDNKVSQTN